jgi:hypothetical protein
MGCAYWCTYEKEQADWTYRFKASDLAEKLLLPWESWRNEGNRFGVNAFRHEHQGAIVHNIGRINGLSPAGSLALNFGFSALWELAGELVEFASFNDQLFTSFGGSVLGESYYRTGQALSCLWWRDGLHVDTKDWADLRLSVGLGTSGSGPTASFGFSSATNAVADHAKPGALTTSVAAGEITELSMSAQLDARGIEDLKLYAQTVVAAKYRKALEATEKGLRGYVVMAGYAPSFELAEREARAHAPFDRLCELNLVGATIHYTYYAPSGTVLHAKGDLYGNLSMVQAYAASPWKAANPGRPMQAAMDRGYFHGAGVHASAAITASRGPLEASAAAKLQRYTSYDFMDVRRDALAAEPYSIDDSKQSYSLSVGYALTDRFVLRASVDVEKRTGQIMNSRVESRLATAGLTLEHRFGDSLRQRGQRKSLRGAAR